jgi:hypothetical protein
MRKREPGAAAAAGCVCSRGWGLGWLSAAMCGMMAEGIGASYVQGPFNVEPRWRHSGSGDRSRSPFCSALFLAQHNVGSRIVMLYVCAQHNAGSTLLMPNRPGALNAHSLDTILGLDRSRSKDLKRQA